MTIAQEIKRFGIPIAVCLGVMLTGVVILSWMIDRSAVQRSIESQIQMATGLNLVVGGDINVSLFPGSYVTLRNARLTSDNTAEPILNVDSLTVNLRLLPLLLRRFEIADVTLRHPRITVTRDAEGHYNWTPLVKMLAHWIKPDSGSPISFSDIKIKNGVLIYHDEPHHIFETVTDIDISFAWPIISRSFAATGQFDWRGERIDGSLSIHDFIATLSGERSGLKVRLAGKPLKFAFDGAIANRTSLMTEGTLTVDSTSLRDALRWAGQPLPSNSGFGQFTLKARVNMVGPSIALTNVNMEVDGNVAEGVLTYSNNGRQMLQATLASNTLDIGPYVNAVQFLAGARDWNRQPFDLHSLSTVDLDIRLSAAKITAGASKLGRTAISANLRNGVLALSIGEAQIFGGILKGSFGITHADAIADVKTHFQFTDIDLEVLTNEMFGNRGLAGRGHLNLALEASGSSPYEFAQSLDGTLTLTGHNGTLIGFNVEQLLRRLERRPLSGAGEFRSGHTPFNTLNIALRFDKGIVTVEDARVEGPSTRLMLTGTASVPIREYDLKGVASLVTPPSAPPAFELPFVLQGPWDDPLLFPDSEALIRRSPASAPLLNAVRDSRNRDAVRSVIDRLKGAPKAAPEAIAPEIPSPAAAETPPQDSPPLPTTAN